MADSARGSPTGRGNSNAKKTARKRLSFRNAGQLVIQSLGNLSRRARSGSRGSRGSRGNGAGSPAGARYTRTPLPNSLPEEDELGSNENGAGGSGPGGNSGWGGEEGPFRPIAAPAPSRPQSMRLNAFLSGSPAPPNRSESRGAASAPAASAPAASAPAASAPAAPLPPIGIALEDKIVRIEPYCLLRQKKGKKSGTFYVTEIDETLTFAMVALRVAKAKMRANLFDTIYAKRIPGLETVERNVGGANLEPAINLRRFNRVAGRFGFQTRRARNVSQARSESRRRREESEARQRAVEQQAERMRTLLSLMNVELVWAHLANPGKTMIQLQNEMLSNDTALMNGFYIMHEKDGEKALATLVKEIQKDAAKTFYKREFEIRMAIEEPMVYMFNEIVHILNRGVEDQTATNTYDRILAAQTQYEAYSAQKRGIIREQYSEEDISRFYDYILNFERLIDMYNLVVI